MLENFMLIGLGFFIATLFALIAVQLTWRRAVNQTTQKITQDLNLDELKQSSDRAAMLAVSLQDKHSELSDLAAKNAQLESTLANARDNALQLHGDVENLQTQHAAAQAEAAEHLQNVTLLQARVEALETVARHDVEQRGVVETQLRALGDKANRLLNDMSLVASEIGHTHSLLATATEPAYAEAEITPPPAPAHVATTEMQVHVAPVSLTPFRDDDVLLSDDMPDLAEIKASLASLSEGTSLNLGEGQPLPADITAEPVSATESYIADRIRALKSGAPAH
ncbi:MAG: hypothetical protein ACOH12_14165 [Parvibaculaceae bacterium]